MMLSSQFATKLAFVAPPLAFGLDAQRVERLDRKFATGQRAPLVAVYWFRPHGRSSRGARGQACPASANCGGS